MCCLQIAISSLKWKARSFCIWASTGGKPSKTDHLQPFRLAGTECAWEKTNSPANGSSISPGTSAVTRNGRATTTIYGLPPSSCGRIAAQAKQRIHAKRGASTDAQETAAVRDFSPLYVRVRLGHSAMSARCPVCPKADTTGRFMSTRPSLTPLADLGRSAGQAPLHRLHAAGIAAARDDAEVGARLRERPHLDVGLGGRLLDS